MPRTMRLYSLLFILFLASCSRDPLSVYTHYVTVKDLASYYVETPDPLLEDPPFEQRLIIEWHIPREIALADPLVLSYTVRFRNLDEVTETIAINKRNGRELFRLPRDLYAVKGGILTYRVQLLDGEACLSEWKHPLWKEMIR